MYSKSVPRGKTVVSANTSQNVCTEETRHMECLPAYISLYFK